MKKTLALIITLIMIFACLSISASAMIGVDESLTDASEYVAPNAKTRVVTYYTPEGDPIAKEVHEFDEKTNTETVTTYENNDGEMTVYRKDVTVYGENSESRKSYSLNSKGELTLRTEFSSSSSDTKFTFKYTYYDVETGAVTGSNENERTYDDKGRQIKYTYVGYDGEGNWESKSVTVFEYSADGNTSLSHGITDWSDGSQDERYTKEVTTVNGNTTTSIYYYSDDGVEYLPDHKYVDINKDECHFTEEYYEYDLDIDDWKLIESEEYELDDAERHVADYMRLYGRKISHVYAADGSKGTHIAYYEDDSFAEKIEESFIDRYKRSVIKGFNKEGDGEWENSYEYVFEYNDAEKTYKVSTNQYRSDAGGNKVLTEYAIVEYDLVEIPEENPESGDLVSVAVTLMSFAAIGGTTLITRRKSR